MNCKKEEINLDFVFECEYCAESWSESLLDLIDRCTIDELLCLLKHIQGKINLLQNISKKSLN
ncbi:MAG: hypothetical protein JSV23_07785 [Promethearchaeota archaeon]|nr:MAG: hypothetical protein JSV23_07785 [Candidatus Lokiarchaeota archaeon]